MNWNVRVSNVLFAPFFKARTYSYQSLCMYWTLLQSLLTYPLVHRRRSLVDHVSCYQDVLQRHGTSWGQGISEVYHSG